MQMGELPRPLCTAPRPPSTSPSPERKRIYRVPVLAAPFCRALLQELEHFEQSDLPKGRPNSMNNYGVRPGGGWTAWPWEASISPGGGA